MEKWPGHFTRVEHTGRESPTTYAWERLTAGDILVKGQQVTQLVKVAVPGGLVWRSNWSS